METCVWNFGFYGCTRTAIEEICGGSQSLGPERGGDVSLEHKGAHSVINGTYGTLGFAVLLGSVGARQPQCGAVGGEKSINSLVEKLGTVICLEGANSDTKLRARVSEKSFKSTCSTRFVT